MDIKLAQKELERIQKQRAKSRRGWEYFQLLKRRREAEEAQEAAIEKMGLKHLSVNHEIARKEDGKWSNTKKDKKPSEDKKTDSQPVEVKNSE